MFSESVGLRESQMRDRRRLGKRRRYCPRPARSLGHPIEGGAVVTAGAAEDGRTHRIYRARCAASLLNAAS
jgi:hypothetical protein